MASITDFLVDFGIFLYFVIGSSSLGYIYLRMGWPKIRVLHPSYKKGWSFIFGASFFIVITLISLFFGFFSFFGIGFREFLFLFIGLSFFLAIGALTVRRKFFQHGPVNVSIPATYLQAKIAASKAQNQLSLDPEIVIVDTHKAFLNDIEKSREIKKMRDLSGLIINKNLEKKIVSKKLSALTPEKIIQKKPEKIKQKKHPTIKTTDFGGMEVKDLFGEQKVNKFSEQKPVEKKSDQLLDFEGKIETGSTKEEETGLEDVEEIEKLGKELQSFEKDEKPSNKTPLQNILDKKKKKIKFLKDNG